MFKNMSIYWIFFITSIFISCNSNAASFNCQGKLNKVEKTICDDVLASTLDDALSDLYKQLLQFDQPKKQDSIRGQKEWMVNRNKCSDISCVREAYLSRIKTVQNLLVNAKMDEDIELINGLTLSCEYQKLGNKEIEIAKIASIEAKPDSFSNGELIKNFQNKGVIIQKQSFNIQDGQSAECTFPSGHRVKIKVGSEIVNPYGQCGADPEIYYSMWANERKIISTEQFAGHCMDRAEFTFIIRNGKITRCQFAENASGVGSKPNCEEMKNVSEYVLDKIEYPSVGTQVAKPGSVTFDLNNSAEICSLASNGLSQRSLEPFGQKPDDNAKESTKIDYTKLVPTEIPVDTQDVYDFDNDGKLDLVFEAEFFNHYMASAVLLVESGTSSKELKLAQEPISNNSWYIPCQLGNPEIKLKSCPPLSQDADEAGFEIKVNNKKSVHFRGRYTQLTPRTYKGRTYLWIVSSSANTTNYYAVIEPLPQKKFRPVCLMHIVQENF
jgi:uncharacterized protein